MRFRLHVQSNSVSKYNLPSLPPPKLKCREPSDVTIIFQWSKYFQTIAVQIPERFYTRESRSPQQKLTDFLCLCILHKLLSLFYLCSLFYVDLILGFNVCFTPSKRVRPLLNSCGYWWNKIMGLTHQQVHSPVWWSREQIAANRGGYQSVRKIHCNWFWGQIGMNLRIFILKKNIYIYRVHYWGILVRFAIATRAGLFKAGLR